MTVALDTMTIIWGLQADPRGGNPRQKNLTEMQRRAFILLDLLASDKTEVIIPTIIVSELLIKVSLVDQVGYLAELQKRFFMPSFDLPASCLAANLWLQHKKLPKDEQITRTTLKSDVMIVASAKMGGATKFYSNDEKCRKLAKLAGMEANDLPLFHPDMHRDAEIKAFGDL